MATPTLSSSAGANRSPLFLACASGAAIVGVVLVVYAAFVIPSQMAGLTSPPAELLAFVAVAGLLSLVGAIGYWLERTWGWFVHLASVLGQLMFPGSLFELKFDLYHIVGWVSPILSLAILILMGLWFRRKK